MFSQHYNITCNVRKHMFILHYVTFSTHKHTFSQHCSITFNTHKRVFSQHNSISFNHNTICEFLIHFTGRCHKMYKKVLTTEQSKQ
jgi:hypothetical protein